MRLRELELENSQLKQQMKNVGQHQDDYEQILAPSRTRIGQDMIVLVVEKNYAEEKMWKLSSSLSRFLTSIYSDLESAVTDVE